MSLSAKIKFNWPLAVSPLNFLVSDTAIQFWDSQVLGPQPTIAQIEAIVLPDEPDLHFVTPSEFIARLTDAEVVAFEASTNATVIRHWLDLTTYNTDLNDLDTLDRFELFIALNLLTEQRAAEILA